MITGLLLCGAGLALACWGVFSVTRIGTCASGGPYVSARQCPEGTELKALAIVAGTFLGLAGLACYAAGRGGRGVRGTLGLGVLMWSLTFLGLAGAVTLAAFGPGAPPDNDGARIAAIVLLVVFVPLGLIPLVGAPLLSRASRRERKEAAAQRVPLGARVTPERTAPVTTPLVPFAPGPPPASPADPVDQLERLVRLRDAGAIDAAEFERLKDQIIGA